jgi:hypothetical protein
VTFVKDPEDKSPCPWHEGCYMTWHMAPGDTAKMEKGMAEGQSDYASDSATFKIPNKDEWYAIQEVVRRNWNLLKPYVELFRETDELSKVEVITATLRKLLESDINLIRQGVQANWAVLKPLVDELTKEVKRAELLESYGPDNYATGTTITWSHKPKGTYEAEHISATKQTNGLWTLTDNSQDRIQGTWEEMAHDFWTRDDLMYQPNVYTAWERIGKGARRAQA